MPDSAKLQVRHRRSLTTDTLCRRCGIEPHLPLISYCRGCRNAVTKEWTANRKKKPRRLAILSEERAPQIPEKQEPLRCNNCGVFALTIRALIAHKKGHSSVRPEIEMYSILPSTAAWDA